MTLRPCPGCRRHVRDEACPFCGAAVPASPPRPLLAGRLSRAAVFAGATLAGCTQTPPPQRLPPPPPDEQQHRDPDPPPPPPPDDGAFARPPAATGTITGIVSSTNGSPMSNVGVILTATGTRSELHTDGTGRFEFRDLTAGDYQITLQQQSNHPRRPAPRGPTQAVKLGEGATEQLTFTVAPYVVPPDTGPCCKPYGAPPARRRVV